MSSANGSNGSLSLVTADELRSHKNLFDRQLESLRADVREVADLVRDSNSSRAHATSELQRQVSVVAARVTEIAVQTKNNHRSVLRAIKAQAKKGK